MRIAHRSILVLALAMAASAVTAGQVDIIGPPQSGVFGRSVTVLPNGNIVVTDPNAGSSRQGAVYLYSPAGVLISTLTGSSDNDEIGFDGVVVLANGNYVIESPHWGDGSTSGSGAVTWADAESGVSGVVSAANSLVGTRSGDRVGEVTALANGNYVVSSPDWDNGTVEDVGAVTWADGDVGRSGPVSVTNSLVGATHDDAVGDIVELSNGHFLSVARGWNNGSAFGAGAVTWINGATGLVGVVSPSNSLVGTTAGDMVGADLKVITTVALANGNYVVGSPNWDNGAVEDVGAVTWVDGDTGAVGPVTPANSLIGSTAFDQVSLRPATALSNGHVAIRSQYWNHGAIAAAGAVTWMNGETGLVGVVSPANSLVGRAANDEVGREVTALTNGNYVVASFLWDGDSAVDIGAVTWADGDVGVTGPVTSFNSLVGISAGDQVGSDGVVALANGNYVIASANWDNGQIVDVGAVTWVDGAVGQTGKVSVLNSLTGTSPGDVVGVGGEETSGVTALANGNYVVNSAGWDNGAVSDAGAATWGDGSVGLIGTVSQSNSLVGTQSVDLVGIYTTALTNGHYVVSSPRWDVGGAENVGAVTWGDGSSGVTGELTFANSLIGGQHEGRIGSGGVTALDDGGYVIWSPLFDNGSIVDAGVITLSGGDPGLVSMMTLENSVIGNVEEGQMPFDYDETREQLAIGRPKENIVTLLTLPRPDAIFADGFENPEVVTGVINLPVANDFSGSALDLVTGSYLPYDENHEVDINLYNRTGGLRAYWYANLETDLGGVSTDGVSYDVLDSGDVIGAQSPLSRSQDGLEAHWWGGADGYLGIAFLNEETGATNYGYIHLTTSAPNGYPAQVLEYAYNNAGNAITIP